MRSKKRDPRWIAVSKILAAGAQFRNLVRPLGLAETDEDEWTDNILGVASRIRQYLLPVQTVDVDDYETAAEIFNRVNTGGTRLSKGDLVMGSMAARWSGGRQAVEDFESDLRDKGWGLNREVLLRIMSVLAVAAAPTIFAWCKGLGCLGRCLGRLHDSVLDAINFLRDDGRIPSKSLLPTEYVALLPSVFLHDRSGRFQPGEADQLIRWVLLASAFGHYSGSVETRLAADIALLRNATSPADALPSLIRAAQEPRTPDLALSADDLFGRTMKSPLLRLLQLRATQLGAASWVSNRAITWDPNHKGLAVEVHHIFPEGLDAATGQGRTPRARHRGELRVPLKVGQHQYQRPESGRLSSEGGQGCTPRPVDPAGHGSGLPTALMTSVRRGGRSLLRRLTK